MSLVCVGGYAGGCAQGLRRWFIVVELVMVVTKFMCENLNT